VIPVLVNDAKKHRSTELPETLKAFSREDERLRQKKADGRRREQEKRPDEKHKRTPEGASRGFVAWLAGLPSEISWLVPIGVVLVYVLGWFVPGLIFTPTTLGWGRLCSTD
jgi:hypothetical protein